MRLWLLMGAFFVHVLTFAQQTEEKEIDKVLSQLYHYLSFKDTVSAQMDSLPSLFLPEARMIANVGKQPRSWTAAQYVATVQENVRKQGTTSVTEKQITRKIDWFGKIAHVFSTYELTVMTKGQPVIRRGINSIQLIRKDNRWLIVSLIWDREEDYQKLPTKYLSK